MSLFTSIRRFHENERGNFAMMFALSLVPIFGMVGAAIDYARVSEVRAKIADVLDAGVLAVGAEPNISEEDAYDIVNSWVDSHLGNDYARLLAARFRDAR